MSAHSAGHRSHVPKRGGAQRYAAKMKDKLVSQAKRLEANLLHKASRGERSGPREHGRSHDRPDSMAAIGTAAGLPRGGAHPCSETRGEITMSSPERCAKCGWPGISPQVLPCVEHFFTRKAGDE